MRFLLILLSVAIVAATNTSPPHKSDSSVMPNTPPPVPDHVDVQHNYSAPDNPSHAVIFHREQLARHVKTIKRITRVNARKVDRIPASDPSMANLNPQVKFRKTLIAAHETHRDYHTQKLTELMSGDPGPPPVPDRIDVDHNYKAPRKLADAVAFHKGQEIRHNATIGAIKFGIKRTMQGIEADLKSGSLTDSDKAWREYEIKCGEKKIIAHENHRVYHTQRKETAKIPEPAIVSSAMY